MIYILTVKKRRNWHRHDYSEHDDSGKVNIQQVLLMLLGIKPSLSSVGFYISKVTLFISLWQAVQTGTVVFIKELKNRTFPRYELYMYETGDGIRTFLSISRKLFNTKTPLNHHIKDSEFLRWAWKPKKTLITCLWGKTKLV